MRGEQYLTRPRDFAQVHSKGNVYSARLLVLKTIPNGTGASRYGFSISKRVGKAVVRNKIKRRLREIMRRLRVKGGWDIVLIARAASAAADYTALQNEVSNLLNRARLLTGEPGLEEVNTGAGVTPRDRDEI